MRDSRAKWRTTHTFVVIYSQLAKAKKRKNGHVINKFPSIINKGKNCGTLLTCFSPS